MSHSTLTQLERGLQSNSLAEILPTISNCAKAIRENPFPLFVNGLLLRLAEVFQGDKIKKLEQSLNLLRLRIIKLLRECGSDLSVAFSSEEVVRRVMKVSHSNDYKSRSLTMLFLAAVAPVVFENKKLPISQVHYLLVEGLDCDEISELTSAIIATGSMGRLSYEFSSLVVEKIGDMVSQTQTDPNIKVRLMDDLSFFQENVAVTNHCMELGRNLLQDNPSQQIAVAVVGALTELAKRNGLALTEQIDLILDELERVQQNTTLLTCYIANLLELADAPQHWTLEQVNKLQLFQSKVVNSESERALILWLQCLNSLAKHVHGNTLSACGSHIIVFAYDKNLNVRINFLEVMFSLLKNTEKTDLAWSVGPCIISIINELTDRECTASMNERMKFYKMLVDFVKDGGSAAIDFDLNGTIRSLTKIDDSYAHVVFTKTLETLNALCECQPDVAKSICDWSLELLNRSYGQANGRLFCDVPSELYSLALLPFEKNTSRLKQLMNKVVGELEQKKNFWFAYKLTRHAFRYGHWNTIAVPLLERLRGTTTTIETSSFLSALYEIANAKLPKKVDVSTLSRSQKSLGVALMLMTPLARNSRNSHNFLFVADYVDCLSALFGALKTVLVMLNLNMGSDPFSYGIAHMEYLRLSLENASEEFGNVRQKWLCLLQRSFDADEDTQQHLELMARYCFLIQSILERLASSDPQNLVLPHPSISSSMNREFLTLIDWGVMQSNETLRPVTGSVADRVQSWSSNLSTFIKIFSHLCQIPLTLPRFFFQQLWRTTVILNVMPQPKEHENTLIISAKQVAITVEGIINSTNPKKIVNVIVQLKIYLQKSTEPRTTEYRQCVVKDNYFKAQFLLDIRKNAEIITSITFTDAETKRMWEANSTNKLNVTTSDPRE
ncbi:hypothetical protein M3Y95_00629400 [Aphelenchoides besseyi]|nr:hypothetical protein M3Y95_00629400 [Aphelenchoides besseyi]